MIRNTYIHLPKVGLKKEFIIREQGINDWDDFLERDIKGISKKTKAFYDRKILEAKKELYEGNSAYFTDKVPTTETWRLYEFFKDEIVFLDIETSSSTSMESYLTVIGLYDGIDTKTMVKGINLNPAALKNELKKNKLIVTFNGSSFDLPYLNKKFPGLIPDIPHIDVRHLCNKAGLKGGLKEIEKQIGITRNNVIVERMYGGDPIKLWRMFRATGDKYYLDLLVEYNEEDVINLKKIAEYAIKKIKNKSYQSEKSPSKALTPESTSS